LLRMTKTKEVKPKCKECGRSLVMIGRDRKNGKGVYKDWGTREFHKKCFKLVKQREMFQKYLDRQRKVDDNKV
jgi:hypothetical protein